MRNALAMRTPMPVTVGQTWKATQRRDRGRLVRVAGCHRGFVDIETIQGGRRLGRAAVASERTLRSAYALVGFEVVDEWGQTVAEGLTYSEAVAKRKALWETEPLDTLTVFGPHGEIACAPRTRDEP